MPAFTLDDADTQSLPAASIALPLRVLCGTFNGTTYTTELNGDLARLFLAYARYMKDARDLPDPLSAAIYDNWIKNFLNNDGTALTSGENAAALLLLIDDNRPRLLKNGVYLYLGIYYFVVWYLAVKKDTNAWAAIRRYVIKEMRKWRDKGATKRKIREDSFFPPGADPELVSNAQYENLWRDASVPASAFKTDRPISKSVDPKALTQIFLEGMEPDRPLSGEDQKLFYPNALLAFKQAILDVLDEEVRLLLWLIDPDALNDFHKISWLAVGDGSTTTGFFGLPDVGVLFFEYEMAYDDTFTVKPVHERTLPKVGDRLPSLFLAYVGKEQQSPGEIPEVSVVAGPPAPIAVTLASPTATTSGNFKDAVGFGWKYESGFLVFDEAPNATLKVTFGPSAVATNGNIDEVALLVLSHSLFNRTLQGNEISVDFTFLDNDFLIPTSQWSGFWDSGTELSDLDALIDVLKNKVDCALDFSGTGNGKGRRRSPDEIGAHGSAIEPDSNQLDRGVSNSATEPRNAPLRYSHGQVQWIQQFGGRGDTLLFTALGFVSPPPCTWDDWPFFQEDLKPEHGSGKKIDALATDIGQYLERKAPGGPNARIIYNSALCGFRAFSLLEAMISRFKNRIADRVFDNTITNERATAMVAKLQVLLLRLKVPISRGQTDRSVRVTLDYALFHKYAD